MRTSGEFISLRKVNENVGWGKLGGYGELVGYGASARRAYNICDITLVR
jgi:hypothetical protein